MAFPQALLLCSIPLEKPRLSRSSVAWWYCRQSYFAFTVNWFKATRRVNKCMGITLQSSPKVLVAVRNKPCLSSFDLGMSWQVDLSGYILPAFKIHLSCSPAALVRMLCGTRHSEHLIILYGSQIQITKPINKDFPLRDLCCSLALSIGRLASRAVFEK